LFYNYDVIVIHSLFIKLSSVSSHLFLYVIFIRFLISKMEKLKP